MREPAAGRRAPDRAAGRPDTFLTTRQQGSVPALPAGGPPASVSAPRWRPALLLAALCFLVYNANLHTIAAKDTAASRYIPFGLWHYRTLSIGPFQTVDTFPHGPFQLPQGTFNLYPVVLPVVLSPLYLPAVADLDHHAWDPDRQVFVANVMEKLMASSIATAAVFLFYLTLRRRVSPVAAMVIAIAFAFGTNTWVIGSQALWQHGFAELLLTSALYLVTGPATPLRATVLGLVLGLACGNRPPDALLAAGFGLYGLWWARRWWPALVAGAALPVAVVVWFNLTFFHHLEGAYGGLPIGFYRVSTMLNGLGGLLISPARGLLVFSPFLLFVPLGIRAHWRSAASSKVLTALMVGGILAQIAFYSRTDWRAGASWGPRFLTELSPLLVWLLAPAYDRLRTTPRVALWAAIAASIAIQAVGAFWYVGTSDRTILRPTPPEHQFDAAWTLANLPFLTELQHPPVPAGFLSAYLRGKIESLRIDGFSTEVAIGPDLVEMEGWVVGRTEPPRLVIAAEGAAPLARTRDWMPRADIVSPFPGGRPLGWHLSFSLGSLRPGSHIIGIFGLDVTTGQWLPIARRRLAILRRRGTLVAPILSVRVDDLLPERTLDWHRIRGGR